MSTYQVRTDRLFSELNPERNISAKVTASSREKAALTFLEYYKPELHVGETVNVAVSKYQEIIHYKVKKGFWIFSKTEVVERLVNRYLFKSYEIILGVGGGKSAGMMLLQRDDLIKKEEDYWEKTPELIEDPT